MQPIKVLVISDESDLEALIRQKFQKRIRTGEFQFLFAKNKCEALKHLQANRGGCLVLGDITMPEMDGLTLLVEFKKRYLIFSTIIIIAAFDMQIIRRAMRLGLNDFLIKPVDVDDLEAALDREIQSIDPNGGWKISEGRRAEQALRGLGIGDQQYHSLVKQLSDQVADIQKRGTECKQTNGYGQDFWEIIEKMPSAIAVIQRGKVVFVNKALCEIFGETADDLYRMPAGELLSGSLQEPPEEYKSEPVVAGQVNYKYHCEAYHVTRDGREVWIEIVIKPFEWYDKPAFLATISDITFYRRQEKEFKQRMKRLYGENLVLEPCLKDRYNSERLWERQQYYLSMNWC